MKRKEIFLSFFWEYSSIIFQSIAQLLTISILSRLLDAEDFGIMGIVMVILNFAMIFSQLGVGPALIQKKNLNDFHIGTAFSIACLFGLIITLTLFLFSDKIAFFYNEERLSLILKTISILFFFISIGSISEAMLIRKLQFKKLMVANSFGILFGYTPFSIILAYLDYGIWSLIWGIIIQNGIKYLFIMFYYSRFFFRLKRREAKDILFFGTGFSLARLFNFLATNFPEILIGRLFSMTILGVYNRATVIMSFPIKYIGRSLERIIFPVFSYYQNDKQKLDKLYIVGSGIVALITFPISAFFFLNSDLLVYTLLGDKWGATIELLKVISFAIFFRSSYKIGDTIAKSTGFIYQRSFREFIYMVLVASGIYLGFLYDSIFLATIFILFAIFTNYILSVIMSINILKIKYSDYFIIHFPGIILLIIVLFTHYLIYFCCQNLGGSYLQLTYHLIITFIVTIGIIWYFPFTLGKIFVDNIVLPILGTENDYKYLRNFFMRLKKK